MSAMLPTLSKLNGLKVELSPGQNTQPNETRNSKIERKNVKKAVETIIDLEGERECKNNIIFCFILLSIFALIVKCYHDGITSVNQLTLDIFLLLIFSLFFALLNEKNI